MRVVPTVTFFRLPGAMQGGRDPHGSNYQRACTPSTSRRTMETSSRGRASCGSGLRSRPPTHAFVGYLWEVWPVSDLSY
jgi:hypothetical protein